MQTQCTPIVALHVLRLCLDGRLHPGLRHCGGDDADAPHKGRVAEAVQAVLHSLHKRVWAYPNILHMVAHSANRALHDQHAVPVLVAVHGVLEGLISGESRSAAQKMCKPKPNQEQTRSKPALSGQSGRCTLVKT